VRHYRFVACLVCVFGCAAIAAAQDKTYSAETLLATFQKGSSVSVKGAEIKFAGVIAEIKKTRVVFKSSGDDKIICELVSPIGTSKDVPIVGGSLTVVGRVRGRGMLGNVTLDPCVRMLAEPEPAPAPVVIPEPVPEKLEPPPVIAQPPPEPVVVLPPPEPAKKPPVARVSSVPSSTVAAPPLPRTAPEPVVDATEPDAVRQPETASPQTLPMETSAPPSVRLADYLPLFVATAIGMGVGAFLVFVKMRPATSPALRSESAPTPQEERRAALEALLLGKKKGRK
jgi:hypothetical protein